MPSLFARLRSVIARRKPSPRRRTPSPKRKTPRRASPSVKRSGAIGANWYGGRNYINPMGPLRRAIAK
jgi:hypothetical protein